jgi:hypothetical protein
MSKMNVEVMEQLLKDLAANVGYDLIPAPFDTPFEEASIERLTDSKQFFWTVPASVLNNKEHEDFRKMCIEADIIDTVCTTSFSWPSDEGDHVVILLIDVTRRRRGSIKFVDATAWDISDETDMAAVCNMLIHDLFPGEHLLAFQMNEDAMDEGLDDCWNEQVCIYAACDVNSLHPNDYLHKLGYGKAGMCLVADVFDIRFPITAKDIAELNKPAILLSTTGKLSPQIIEPEKDVKNIFDDKMLLVPNDGYQVDFEFALQLFGKEEVLRQLPITRKITLNDMWRVQLEQSGLYKKSINDLLVLLNECNGVADNS